MDSIREAIGELESNPHNIKYNDLVNICDKFFGEARQRGTSHRVYKMPWAGDPRINIQNDKGKARAYQVRQVIKALKRLETKNGG
jgi:hypothetical protein